MKICRAATFLFTVCVTAIGADTAEEIFEIAVKALSAHELSGASNHAYRSANSAIRDKVRVLTILNRGDGIALSRERLCELFKLMA